MAPKFFQNKCQILTLKITHRSAPAYHLGPSPTTPHLFLLEDTSFASGLPAYGLCYPWVHTHLFIYPQTLFPTAPNPKSQSHYLFFKIPLSRCSLAPTPCRLWLFPWSPPPQAVLPNTVLPMPRVLDLVPTASQSSPLNPVHLKGRTASCPHLSPVPGTVGCADEDVEVGPDDHESLESPRFLLQKVENCCHECTGLPKPRVQ